MLSLEPRLLAFSCNAGDLSRWRESCSGQRQQLLVEGLNRQTGGKVCWTSSLKPRRRVFGYNVPGTESVFRYFVSDIFFASEL